MRLPGRGTGEEGRVVECCADGSGSGRGGGPAHWTERLTVVLLGVGAALAAASLGTRFYAWRRQLADPEAQAPWLMRLFDVNAEQNIPTWYAAGLLLAAALAAAAVAVLAWTVDRPAARRLWLPLAGILAALSLDETVSLHERLGEIGSSLAGDAVHFAWVVPGVAIAAGLAGVLVVGLRRHAGAGTRRRLLLGAGCFGFGAFGVEVLSGIVLEADGDRAGYLLVTAVEESLEILGVVLVLRAVLLVVQASRTPQAVALRYQPA